MTFLAEDLDVHQDAFSLSFALVWEVKSLTITAFCAKKERSLEITNVKHHAERMKFILMGNVCVLQELWKSMEFAAKSALKMPTTTTKITVDAWTATTLKAENVSLSLDARSMKN